DLIIRRNTVESGRSSTANPGASQPTRMPVAMPRKIQPVRETRPRAFNMGKRRTVNGGQSTGSEQLPDRGGRALRREMELGKQPLRRGGGAEAVHGDHRAVVGDVA